MALSHHIENLRAKPHHVRERIAFGTAAGITVLVGLVWVGTLAATGALSLKSDNTVVTDGTNGSGDAQSAIAQTQTNFSQLMGAVGAATGVSTTSAPALRIVDDGTNSTLDSKSAAVATNNSNASVIPF
ncbi:MAG: hypothetical protein JWM39_473 [Parcubacteria group bacterium]|nr:hypothetical protein [Parcubacteria group bacterium]